MWMKDWHHSLPENTRFHPPPVQKGGHVKGRLLLCHMPSCPQVFCLSPPSGWVWVIVPVFALILQLLCQGNDSPWTCLYWCLNILHAVCVCIRFFTIQILREIDCLAAWRMKASLASASLQLKGQVQETEVFGESKTLINGMAPTLPPFFLAQILIDYFKRDN